MGNVYNVIYSLYLLQMGRGGRECWKIGLSFPYFLHLRHSTVLLVSFPFFYICCKYLADEHPYYTGQVQWFLDDGSLFSFLLLKSWTLTMLSFLEPVFESIALACQCNISWDPQFLCVFCWCIPVSCLLHLFLGRVSSIIQRLLLYWFSFEKKST